MINFWIKMILTVALSAGCGWAWRFGGSKNGIRWVREVGTGIALIVSLTIWYGWSIWYLPIMGLSFAESTYFKAKGTDARWYNWLCCGILYAVVPLPAVVVHHLWHGFLIRSLVIIPVITLWRTFQGNVQWSESGAGVWQVITLPLLSIH